MVPDLAKRMVRSVIWRFALRLAESQQPERPLNRRLLRLLHLGWGNPAWSANVDYLTVVADHAARADAPILECGSGLSTVVLALAAGRRGVAVFSLEHDPDWRSRVTAALDRASLARVELLHAPLVSHGEFDWYDVAKIDFPESFSLVVCDGPPGGTRGGRYGLLPVMTAHLGTGTVILLDDAQREGELNALARWSSGYGVRAEVREHGEGTFAIATTGRDSDVPANVVRR